ncbi:MAG: glycosyltransferase family 4 protein [Prolixibacteraceae bacterium]|nr:glycosyltransferase family 4 protein [Prolixibacteraceae bacterium]
MNVLWIVNIQFPAIRKKFGLHVEVLGGWMYSLAIELVKDNKIKLAVCTTYNGNDLQVFRESDMVYYLLPGDKYKGKYDKSLEFYWSQIVEEYKPDIIHIHGTEFAHGLACINACPKERYVISVQGLVSVISRYFYAGIDPLKLIKYTTLSDIKNSNTLPQALNKFKRRGELEQQYLRLCRNIIGRTFWDYSNVMSLNPDADYHFCNEVLRSIFYDSIKWNIEDKKNHTLFMSNASSPNKGLHQVLKAIFVLREFFPDVQLRIAGVDITGGNKWVHRNVTYGAYIRSLIKKYRLNKNVQFLGRLEEAEMVNEFRNAHVYICASAIENSPNSLGEAQLIGTPCIASFVGGIPDMVRDGETGLLYPFNDSTLLAFKTMKLFNDDKLARHISEMGRVAASARHNRETIKSRMLDIYDTLKKT